MKNQHFGENLDLLKFDLVNQILHSKTVECFYYMPMLTPDDPGQEPEDACRGKSSGGKSNSRLVDFLDFCVINEKRDPAQLEQFFKGEGYQASVYAPQQFLTPENRRDYFAGFAQSLPKKALILIDPDQGIEDDDIGPANLMYSELEDIYNRMDEDSILMFTQRFKDEKRPEYLAKIRAEIQEQIPFSQPISLDDLDSIIFFLPRNQKTLNRLVEFLKKYTQEYFEKAE